MNPLIQKNREFDNCINNIMDNISELTSKGFKSENKENDANDNNLFKIAMGEIERVNEKINSYNSEQKMIMEKKEKESEMIKRIIEGLQSDINNLNNKFVNLNTIPTISNEEENADRKKSDGDDSKLGNKTTLEKMDETIKKLMKNISTHPNREEFDTFKRNILIRLKKLEDNMISIFQMEQKVNKNETNKEKSEVNMNYFNQEIKKMSQNFYNLKRITPEELGLNKQFCLNISSLNYQEEILTKKLEELNKVIIEEKNEENDEDINDINNNNENDVPFQKKKIGIILDIVRDNKKKVQRYGDREIEETKVNLNFEENYDFLPKMNNTHEFGLEKTNPLEYIPEEFGLRKMSLLPIHELYDEQSDFDSSYYSGEDEINTISKSISNKTMIVRTPTESENVKEKLIKLPKLQKIFNRVSYTRTKNIEYLSYPYETAIQLLKQVKKYQTPFEKMMIFASISGEITNCINDFWKDLNGYIKNDLLNLEIDQLMTIFIYIIIQSQITDISVHCKIIKSFTTCITKASMIGYYYSTVEASVQYISSLNNIEEFFKNKLAK